MNKTEEKLKDVREQIAKQNQALQALRELVVKIEPDTLFQISREAMDKLEASLDRRHVALCVDSNLGLRA